MTYSLLAGTRVIESSAFIAAPLCGLTLAQYGADVIRFDLIGGGIDYRRLPVMPGGRSVYWTSLNKGKRSIAIDIRKPEGKDLLRALVTAPGADTAVLLTNVPSAFLSHDALSVARPDLISCTIEGNGDGSTAVDYTVHCATGYPMITGTGSREHPVNQTLPAWDLAAPITRPSQ
jgi:2-methylfumaryl-CoA isomerase